MPSMFIMKANAKENQREIICLSMPKAKAIKLTPEFHSNGFHADGSNPAASAGFAIGPSVPCHEPLVCIARMHAEVSHVFSAESRSGRGWYWGTFVCKFLASKTLVPIAGLKIWDGARLTQ